MRASNGTSVPLSASVESAPATSADPNTRSAVNNTSSAIAVDTWVPLISASPSLGPSASGSRPRCLSASPAWSGSRVEQDLALAEQSGARYGRAAPGRPTRRPSPGSGSPAVAPAATSASSRSTSSRRTPLWPRARPIAFSTISSRTILASSASPSPQLCDRIRLVCSSASRASGIRVWARIPKPVLIP